MGSTIRFWFKHIDADGKPCGFFAKSARVEEDVLVLDNRTVPLCTVSSVHRQPGRIILYLDGEPAPLVLAFKFGHGGKVLKAIALRSSLQRSRWHEQELVRRGMSRLFASFTCPHCGYTTELSGFPGTPQVYCFFCNRVLTVSPNRPPFEGKYILCGRCGVFGRRKQYLNFLIMFALFFYYSKIEPRTDCVRCMRRTIWSNFLGNFFLLIGAIPALWQLARAYWLSFDPLRDLDRANRLAQKGKFERALPIYEFLAQRVRYCAPVRYNCGATLSAAGHDIEAMQQLEQCIANCGNFIPAYALLEATYASQGMVDKQGQLRAILDSADRLANGDYSLLAREENRRDAVDSIDSMW